MLYPIIVHEEDGGYTFTAPDFPSCFSEADSQEEIQPMLQDVVQLVMEETGADVPVPSSVAELAASEEAQGGFVMLVDVDLSFLEKTAKRYNISTAPCLMATIDRAAKVAGKSRSQYLIDCGLKCAPRNRPQGEL
ncbi:type II toxin-antitoxin system HicB family antitoxin (plasmid) [Halodesulfovibrio aestuarii]|uniref:HicB_like antitoxin of toxin-antitoxin system n=1 Tax=Halodesulfovibrio aestuarii TaxID=126333 RepID=A0A8G2CC63_9BACT|nr:type II toxin-antitoxin system HicB family antitoxin [Halodesulfovibrio aestuarii]SHJ71604.1 HicB_like antitoxin of toxin-antitoxin system [Halodesulfovibrio aestuarii]